MDVGLMNGQRVRQIFVHSLPGRPTRGMLHVGLVAFPCALGRSGIRTIKREGDGATPRARLPLRRVFFRKDRLQRPASLQTIRAIRPTDAWCDDARDRRYNRLIARPPGTAEECLIRDDHLYNVIVELGWNDQPVRRHHGSAIFWHGARDGLTPTAGCVAIPISVFAKILPRLARNAVMIVR
ncbi:L,D-transpeptidase catalytic domain protein [Phreatobacter aquaticus]|uniref:L,D-transpeptidase catalytic domain protein n=2 Tax=Phreatobacter aquaticus TaxID=2570229 RepID=A0A4D7QIK4_9HYPH|nr:L,D-transpeptidase catalytic domain protein [Phreatobacter aquaticus]